ncbi:meiosis-specific nuclear structural protein 1 isoform X3 [Dendroctonus ponderosae]|uniref:meiosis-specific nuclear structural protein 1 isoform X3 n=1 Tax=Dendroctonus ponderosae TaxID=77166 RepID=UPI002034ECDC|nr:meiosis-specific nuclear structural protein 1 isoform X3 [Dendroctonus ponderosae]
MDLFRDKNEERRTEHLTRLSEDKLQLCKTKMEEKTRFGNLVRFMNKQRKEFEDEQQIQIRNEEMALNEYQHDQENNLARELSKIKSDELKQLKLRQQLRENSHELRDLERKLKAAYVNKELAAQIAEKEAERQNEKIQERRTHELLQEAQIREKEFKKMLTEEDMVKKAQYKKELQDQIILGEESKRYLYEEFLREKKMIDDIIQRIHDEDEREIHERMCKMQKTREEMMAFKAAQEAWKRKKKQDIEEENIRIQEFLQKKSADSTARFEEHKRKEEVKAKIQEDLAKQIYAQTIRKKEREDILQELMVEEQKEALERRHREEIEKQIRQRIEVRESLTEQLKEKEDRCRQEAIEDGKYKQQAHLHCLNPCNNMYL